jgi:hypothetical protein
MMHGQTNIKIRKLFELCKGVSLDAYCLSNTGEEIIFKSRCEQTGSIFSGVFFLVCKLYKCIRMNCGKVLVFKHHTM